MTQAEFGEALAEPLEREAFSKQAVSLWEKDQSAPGYTNMVLLTMRSKDWRRDFAQDVLAVLDPERWVCPNTGDEMDKEVYKDILEDLGDD